VAGALRGRAPSAARGARWPTPPRGRHRRARRVAVGSGSGAQLRPSARKCEVAVVSGPPGARNCAAAQTVDQVTREPRG